MKLSEVSFQEENGGFNRVRKADSSQIGTIGAAVAVGNAWFTYYGGSSKL